LKTLLLLRHAKSDWGDSSLRDFDRPLATRGEKDAPRIGKALNKRGPLPDFIVSSPAARAKATIEAVAAAAGIDLPIEFEEKIYGATSAELMTVIRRLPADSSCALLVGHNPGFEDLARRLSGRDQRMPTAALACINFEIADWENVEDERGNIAWLITPKNLAD
jgi:phosphohistidine phosphatase